MFCFLLSPLLTSYRTDLNVKINYSYSIPTLHQNTVYWKLTCQLIHTRSIITSYLCTVNFSLDDGQCKCKWIILKLNIGEFFILSCAITLMNFSENFLIYRNQCTKEYKIINIMYLCFIFTWCTDWTRYWLPVTSPVVCNNWLDTVIISHLAGYIYSS